MELRHLRYFKVVAEELHFGRAAKRLNMSQPPLSQQIRNLEQEIGATLLDRDNRNVSLTRAGEQFLHRARTILDASENAAAEARSMSAGHEANISVGYMSSAMLDQFVPVLHRFREDYPYVDVQLTQMPSPLQLSSLIAGELDFAFIDAQPENGSLHFRDQLLSARTAWREAFVAALPVDHRLANKRTISLSDLADDDFVLPPREPATGFYDQVIALCHAAGFSPTLTRKSEVLPVTIALVAAGYGVSIVPACVCQPWVGMAAFVRIDTDPSIGVTMAWDPERTSPVNDAFSETVNAVSPDLITHAFDRTEFLRSGV